MLGSKYGEYVVSNKRGIHIAVLATFLHPTGSSVCLGLVVFASITYQLLKEGRSCSALLGLM